MLPFRRQALWAAAAAVALCTLASTAAFAQDAEGPDPKGRRYTLQDLHPGATLDQMPEWLAFRMAKMTFSVI